MQELERGGRIRLRAGALLVAMLAIVIAAVAAATMSVQAQTTPDPVAPPTVDHTDADLSGRYLGSQDDVRFGMALHQEGTFLRGVIVQPLPQTAETDFIDRDSAALTGDRLFGVLSGDQIFLIRFSDPAQFWFGEVSRSATAIEMKGRWVSSQGEGAWQAKSARGPKLAVSARVAPLEIDAGETTRVHYGVRVDNDGERTARSVQLDLRGLPEFYRIDSIEIVRGRIGDALESLDGTAVAPSSLSGSLSLPLGDLRPDDSVLVRVSGAAAPEDEHEGEHVTRATASADNARSASTRVTLTVNAGPKLTIAARVAPDQIEAGVTSRVTYGVTIVNVGGETAENVQLDVRGLPSFFLIDSINIVRGRIATDLEALPGEALAPSLSGSLSLPLGDLDADHAVLVRIHGLASPADHEVGEHVTQTTASADNARPASARVSLTVGGTLQLANAFSPAVVSASTDDVRPDGRDIDAQRPGVVAGHDGLVTYTITVTAQPFDEVVVTDASIFGILRGAEVNVRGAIARGSLASGLVLTPLSAARDFNSDAVSVTITVTGDAGHLLPGRYAASVSAVSGDQRARSTAILTVIAARDTDRDRIDDVDGIQIDGRSID